MPRTLERLLTDGAGMRFNSSVRGHMRHQDVGSREPSAALITAVGSLASMCPHVGRKVAQRAKHAVAVLTRVLLRQRLAFRLPSLSTDVVSQTGQLRVILVAGEAAEHVALGVLTADVVVQLRRLNETTAADGASVRLRITTGVRSKMGREEMALREQFSTLLAAKCTRCGSGVAVEMDRETPPAGELLIAFTARERLGCSRRGSTELVLVGTQMKHETILPFKGPTALVALKPGSNLLIIATFPVYCVLLTRLDVHCHQRVLFVVINTFRWVVQVLHYFLVLHCPSHLYSQNICTRKTPVHKKYPSLQ